MSINTVYRVFDALHIRMQLGVPVTLQAKADIRHTGRQCIHWDGGGGGGGGGKYVFTPPRNAVHKRSGCS